MINTKNKTLIELDLANNLFGVRGIAHIERGLKGHSFIQLCGISGHEKYSCADYDKKQSRLKSFMIDDDYKSYFENKKIWRRLWDLREMKDASCFCPVYGFDHIVSSLCFKYDGDSVECVYCPSCSIDCYDCTRAILALFCPCKLS